MNSLVGRHGGQIFHLPKEERDSILDFSININPVGLSPEGKAAMMEHWETDITRYPDTSCGDLVKALAKRYSIDPSFIMVGNGATELMYALLAVTQPKKVYIPAPSFSEYRFSAEFFGVEIEELPLEIGDTFHLPWESWVEKITDHSLIYVGNPNNPDGQLLLPQAFEALAHRAKETKSLLVIDESFVDFLGDAYSYRTACQHHEEVVIISSLTKFFAVPGLRIGYGLAHPRITEKWKKSVIPWHVNGPVQRYMEFALQDESYREQSVQFCRKERRRLSQELAAFKNIHVYSGTVNFILCQLRGKFNKVEEFQRKLNEFGIIVRNCGNYAGLDDSYFRVAVRREDENNYLIEVFRKVLMS